MCSLAFLLVHGMLEALETRRSLHPVDTSLAPPGWPVVAPGLLMQFFGPILWVGLGPGVDAEGRARELRELCRAIDQADRGRHIGVLYHADGNPGLDARGRQAYASAMAERRELLRQRVLGCAMVTSSAVSRGVVSAIFWLTPPPCPYFTTHELGDGLQFLRDCGLEGFTVEDVLKEHARMVAQHRHVLRPG